MGDSTPWISADDLALFQKGEHPELFRVMGGRIAEGGASFAVWAPQAQSVHLIGDFNDWKEGEHPMRKSAAGVWEAFVPGLEEHVSYQYLITTQDGAEIEKADPFAYYNGYRPNRASILFDVDSYQWGDSAWIEARKRRNHYAEPMSVYEVHLGSWKRADGQFMNYRELGPLLVDYCKKMSYTHVELMPISGHPLDESWGYQVSGFFSVTSRYGTPRDFQTMVDHLHQAGIGVIVDWVAAHFPIDTYALAQFDGTYLFEHEEMGLHPHWNTLHFDYGDPQVANFLMASALFWIDVMHCDGLRMDAVASMIHLDFGRKEGEWTPNCEGSNINLEAVELLQKLNTAIHNRFPGVLIFAEESTMYQGVTHPVENGGLGFDYKWAMGWMNDTLRFFETQPEFRKECRNLVTHIMTYVYSERYIFPLSHDEVVHEKKSLLEKMPGSDGEKFAQLALLLTLMTTLPSKQLLFMGGEFGQRAEWYEKEELHWNLLQEEGHSRLHKLVERLGRAYVQEEALFACDHTPEGFEWIDCSDELLSFYRIGRQGRVLCLLNTSPQSAKFCCKNRPQVYFETASVEIKEGGLIQLPGYGAAILKGDI